MQAPGRGAGLHELALSVDRRHGNEHEFVPHRRGDRSLRQRVRALDQCARAHQESRSIWRSHTASRLTWWHGVRAARVQEFLYLGEARGIVRERGIDDRQAAQILGGLCRFRDCIAGSEAEHGEEISGEGMVRPDCESIGLKGKAGRPTEDGRCRRDVDHAPNATG